VIAESNRAHLPGRDGGSGLGHYIVKINRFAWLQGTSIQSLFFDQRTTTMGIGILRDRMTFLGYFTPALRSAVLAQDSTQVVRSARGAMVGDSRLWIASVCLDRKCTKRKICVTAVNLGDPAHAPPATIPGHPAH
jgi:hypothetical protein